MAGELAQLVMCFLYKHEGTGLALITHGFLKNLGLVACTCNLSTRRVVLGRPPGLTGHSVCLDQGIQVSARDFASKQT